MYENAGFEAWQHYSSYKRTSEGRYHPSPFAVCCRMSMLVEGGIVVAGSRSKLWNLVSFLAWWEAIVGVVIFVIVARPTRVLSSHLPQSHHNVLCVFYTELLVGLASGAVAVQGVIVSLASLRNPLLKSTTRAYNAWMVIGIALVISLIAVLFVVPAAIEAGKKEILEIMEEGVGYYMSDAEWKTSLDKLHQEFQCCGVNSINDWFKSRWIPITSFRPEAVDIRGVLLEDGTLRPRVVPASCCKPDVNQPCSHDNLQQNTSTGAVLLTKTLFTRGCGELVVNPLASTVGPFKVLSITTLLLQVGQLVMGKYLTMKSDSSEPAIAGERELKKRRKRKKMCRENLGSSCGSRTPGRTSNNNYCSKCANANQSALGSRKCSAKSQSSRTRQAIANSRYPKPTSPQIYDVYWTSVDDDGSDSPLLKPGLASPRLTSKREFCENSAGPDAGLIQTFKSTTANLAKPDVSSAMPGLLGNPGTDGKKWWEPELDLLTLDL